ncbi:MAG: isoprenylcysteine carboxylmethyltransferase family protein [Methyloprofundus sp.]|nr:isoprenylcysteine carboxylmethyltransferase family protein [Methyloprofundus sp.]
MKNTLELKIVPPLAMFISVGLIYAAAHFFPWSIVSLGYKQELTSFFIILAMLFDFSALAFFSRAKTTINPFQPEKSSSLVTSGIYKITRNPMYIGLVCLLIAWTIWVGSLLGFVVIFLFQQYITRFQIMPEERALRQLFGENYDDYCLQVKRWL